jgi:choline dehydrogenase
VIEVATADTYDVLVLGGGVAGCVLADGLSADPSRRVALVEAGPDYGPGLDGWPADALDARKLPRSDVWEYGGQPAAIRGRVIGGSSAINGCWHTWGSAGDFAEWAARGGARWSMESLEPHRRRAAEAMRLRSVPDDELSPWGSASLEAAARLGFPETADMSGAGSDRCAGRPPLNAVGDLRWNAAFAYLDPARPRPNLSILSGTTVDRLVIEGSSATSVEVVTTTGRRNLRANRYVLTAGTYGTPCILLRSGVGPPGELRAVGVRPLVELPGVGRNLADHPGLTLALAPTPALNAALLDRERGHGFYNSQVALKTGSSRCDPGSWDLHLLPTAGFALFGSLPPGEYEVGITAFLMKPRSRGHVVLRSIDPEAPPQIEPCSLTDAGGHDLEVLREGLELARELAASEPLRRWARPARFSYSEAWARERVGSYWHPVGTCAMGPDGDPDAVADGRGRLHGVDNVVIADASLIPSIPRANTQLPVLALAHAVAELLAGE